MKLNVNNFMLTGLIVMLAISRFAYLGYVPLQYDEIHNLIRSVNFNQNINNYVLSIIEGTPSQIFHYLSIKAFGVNEFANRLPVVIQSLIIVTFTYLIAKSLINKKTAVISVIISLLLPYNFAYSRYAQYDIGQTCFFIMGVYFFLNKKKLNIGNNIISAILFGLAFLSKYNSLILQMCLYIAFLAYHRLYIKNHLRKVFINFMVFLIFIILYKSPVIVDFLIRMGGWLGSIFLDTYGSQNNILNNLLTVLKLFGIACTLPICLLVIYSFRDINQLNNIILLFVVMVSLYFFIFIFQGRIQIRYINLIIPFIIIIASYEAALLFKDLNNPKIIFFTILTIFFVVQISISYSCYYKWEKQFPPDKKVGEFLQKELEPFSNRIFLPPCFQTNYVGIMHLHSHRKNYEHPVADKWSKYHIGYSLYNYKEQIPVNSRELLLSWFAKCKSKLFAYSVGDIFESLKELNYMRQKLLKPFNKLTLKELISSSILRKGDVILTRCGKYKMYPALWPGDVLYKNDNCGEISIAHDVIKEFYCNSTDRISRKIIRIN